MSPLARTRTCRTLVAASLVTLALGLGCAASHPLEAQLAPMAFTEAAAPAPAVLREDHFSRDGAGSISEEHLRAVLDSPVFLEEAARVGVVPVVDRYEPDEDLPVVKVPGVLTAALQDSGLYEVATEVTTDWPGDRGIGGLRELAARYRCEYLLLYRQRFVDRGYTNAWALLWPTVVPIFFVPSETMETAGVVEATLFDVRTGTLLFTTYERVHAVSDENIWQNERKRRALKEALLAKAATLLADEVVEHSRRLAAARPTPTRPTAQLAPIDGPAALAPLR